MSSQLENYFQAVETRRSVYQLTDKASISDEELKALVERAVKHTPTSFNMQQSRAVLVLGEKHQQLWDTIAEKAVKGMPGESGQQQKSKIENCFKPGYGSVVFFEDQDTLKAWGEKMPNYSDLFKLWSTNSAGILQHVTWTALAAAGMGASLQHYPQFVPETQDAITKFCGVPDAWTCTAVMPFGVAGGEPNAKEFAPIEERAKVVA